MTKTTPTYLRLKLAPSASEARQQIDQRAD
jgi:hypothetical protein